MVFIAFGRFYKLNKIYCVIWCYIRQAYVVASERASRKKIKSQKQGRTILMMKGLFLSSLIGISSTVLAEENRLNIGQDDGDVIYIGDYDTINPSAFSGIVIGQETVLASGNDVIIIGTGASTHGTNAISIGTDTKSEGDSVAIGAGAEAVSGGIAIGMGSRAIASDEFSVGSKDNERKITNVRSGNIIVDSKDAVNGSQLYTALYSVIDVIGKDSNGQVSNGVISGVDFSRAFDLKRNYITNVYDGFAFTNTRTKELASVLGGSAKITNGTFFGPIYDFGELDEDGNKITYNTVGAALDNIDGRVDINTINIENITTGKAGLVQLSESGEIVIDNTISGADEAAFNLQNADGTARQVTGVEKGDITTESVDAINGSQLLGSLKSLETILGAEVTVDSHGYVSVPSSTFDIGQGNNTISGALNYLNNQSGGGEGLFTYDKDKNQVIFADSAGVKADAELNLGGRVISGVKGGDVAETSSQVVTGSQLWETNQQVEENTQQLKHIQNTFSHYNARLHNIEKTVHQNRKVASAGISGAMAMSSIPYVDHTKYSFGMGAATYDGEAAMSIGFTYKVNQDARFRIQGSYDTQNKAGVGIGFAFGF